MVDNGIWLFVVQLIDRIPVLMACAFGFILAFVYFRRCRLPSILAMLGTAVMGTASLGAAIVQTLLMQVQMDHGAGQQLQYARWMGLVGAMSAIVHAGALVLLLIAVFTGRPRENA
jgi:hypothetical protein